MRFAFIEQHRGQWPLSVVCRVLGVSRQGYRAWHQRQAQPSSRQQADARLQLSIQVAHRQGRGTYGSPRVHQALRAWGIRVSRKRVARLMRQTGLKGVCRGERSPRTTHSKHLLPVAVNVLARRFAPHQVGELNRVWCGDITYLATHEGWLYLATVQDLFSRRIVGWSLGGNLEAGLVVAAWQRALQTRSLGSHSIPFGPQLYHSDQGSQYCSSAFQRLLQQGGTQPSMSRRGERLDNAVSESFFATLKAELLVTQPDGRFVSKVQATMLVGDYIENFYNRMRLHSTLGYRSPVAFELAHQAGQLSAF